MFESEAALMLRVNDRFRGVLPYIGYTGMCRWRGYGFKPFGPVKGMVFKPFGLVKRT